MKLFLTSQASSMVDQIVARLEKPASELKLAFIPTAGDPYGDDKPWMDEDRKSLTDAGFKVQDVDLKNKSEETFRKELKDFDIIFVAGGNTFYLLDWVKKSGFDKVTKELVQNGIIYIGSSAGSYIACPTVEAASWKHADKNIVRLKDWTALNLVNFILVAHYEERYQEMVEANKKTAKYPVYTLTNDQMIVVEEDKYTLVSEDVEYKLS